MTAGRSHAEVAAEITSAPVVNRASVAPGSFLIGSTLSRKTSTEQLIAPEGSVWRGRMSLLQADFATDKDTSDTKNVTSDDVGRDLMDGVAADSPLKKSFVCDDDGDGEDEDDERAGKSDDEDISFRGPRMWSMRSTQTARSRNQSFEGLYESLGVAVHRLASSKRGSVDTSISKWSVGRNYDALDGLRSRGELDGDRNQMSSSQSQLDSGDELVEQQRKQLEPEQQLQDDEQQEQQQQGQQQQQQQQQQQKQQQQQDKNGANCTSVELGARTTDEISRDEELRLLRHSVGLLEAKVHGLEKELHAASELALRPARRQLSPAHASSADISHVHLAHSVKSRLGERKPEQCGDFTGEGGLATPRPSHPSGGTGGQGDIEPGERNVSMMEAFWNVLAGEAIGMLCCSKRVDSGHMQTYLLKSGKTTSIDGGSS